MSRVPRIRFKGFEEDWEQRKHGEVFIYLRNNTLSREELNDEDGFAQSIHYGDVLIKYGECLNVSKELLPYIDNKNIVNKFKKFYIQNGDVIIADTAEDETVGKCIEISGMVDHNIISGLHTIPLRPVNKFAYGYLGFYLNSNSYHNQLKPLMQGIKVTSISKNLFKTTTLNYPSNIQEQKIIGRYFDALNHLITLHQRKLEKLKIIKKSMLENLFPQNGEKTPKIRFSGFTEDWEQRKLGEIAIFNPKSKLPSTFEYVDLESVIGTEIVSHSTETINTAPSRAQRLAKKGDIFYQTVRPYQKNNYLFEKDRGNYVFSTGYAQLRPFVNERFLFYLIQNENFVNTVLYNCTGTSYPAINSSDLRRIDIYLSRSSTEQKCIGNTIKSLDHLITLHQSKSFGHILKVIVSCTLSWEQRKLGECFTERIESMPNGELISVTINDGIKKFSELGRHDNSNDDKSKYKKVCVGDIAYNSMRMWQGASGYSPYEGIVSPAYTVLAANHGVNSRCIAHQFKLSKMIHTFKINSQGITSDNWNLKFTALSDIPIYISKQIDEQCKIAFFLETLDHLITLHQLEPFQLIFKAIAYRIIDYTKSKPPSHRK